jgi:hypothetical protein
VFEPDQRTGKPGAVGIVGNELAEPGLISDPEDTGWLSTAPAA